MKIAYSILLFLLLTVPSFALEVVLCEGLQGKNGPLPPTSNEDAVSAIRPGSTFTKWSDNGMYVFVFVKAPPEGRTLTAKAYQIMDDGTQMESWSTEISYFQSPTAWGKLLRPHTPGKYVVKIGAVNRPDIYATLPMEITP